jgi:hypothetical protein
VKKRRRRGKSINANVSVLIGVAVLKEPGGTCYDALRGELLTRFSLKLRN